MRLLFILLICPILAFGQSTSYVEQNISLELDAGWNMFGYSCYDPMDLVEAFSPIVDKVIIVKDNDGNAYLSEYEFNGIGNLELHQGYQIKLTEAITDFQFCPFLVPLVEGCTDESACNFNFDANTSDGSCLYPEEGFDCLGALICYPINDEGFLDFLKYYKGGAGEYIYVRDYIIDDCLDVSAANSFTGKISIYDESDIKNLDGLQHFINIEKLHIDNNDSLISIPDLSALENLKELYVYENPMLIEIPGLSSLNNLKSLWVFNNPALLVMSEPLNGISLNSIVYFNNGMTYNLENIYNYPNLDSLEVDNFQDHFNYNDYEVFQNLDRYCICGNSGMESIDEIPNFYNLSSLSIDNNSDLIHISDLSALKTLKELYFFNNPVLSVIPDLSELTSLERLEIFDQELSCIGGYPEHLTREEHWPPVCSFGCMDSLACNFDPEANMSDGSCEYVEVYDCDGNLRDDLFEIPDTAFRNYLKENYPEVMEYDYLNIDSADTYGDFFEGEMSIYGPNISDLTGLQYFSNVSFLFIEDNDALTSIPDLSGFSYLTRLDIDNNNALTSIPDLSGLSNLTELYIEDNDALTSLTDLSGLSNLSTLEIANNDALTGIPELSGLSNLRWLYIGDNDALECFIGGYPSQLTIEENWPPICPYDLEGNFRNDLFELPDTAFRNYLKENFPEVMEYDYLNIDSAAALNGFYLDSSFVQNIDGLQYFSNLQGLVIANNDALTSIPELSGLSNLTWLYIEDNDALTSLPDLSGLSNLSELVIYDNVALTSIPELSGLSNLRWLEIRYNDALTSIPELSGLSNLESLAIPGSSFTSIPDLSGLSNLTLLYIEDNDALECVGGYPEQLYIKDSWPPICD